MSQTEFDITHALENLYQTNRIVFWYDKEKNLRNDFESISFSNDLNVEKVELNNNEFKLKYLMLKQQKDKKFLVYHEGEKPENSENWLLDILLANTEFHADKSYFILLQLGLDNKYVEIIKKHTKFFASKERCNAFKKKLEIHKNYSEYELYLSMLAVCVKCEPRLEIILKELVKEVSEADTAEIYSAELSKKEKEIANYDLNNFLWNEIKINYGYSSSTPSMKGFVTSIFSYCSKPFINQEYSSTSILEILDEATVFLKDFKDNRNYSESYKKLSANMAEILKIEDKLQDLDYSIINDIDYFELLEQKIVSSLLNMLLAGTLNRQEVSKVIELRKNTFWYPQYEANYNVIKFVSEFNEEIVNLSLEMDSLDDAVKKYTNSWYRIDYFYRKILHNIELAGMSNLHTELKNKVYDHYSNTYLLPLGNKFQLIINDCNKWNSNSIKMQRDFFNDRVQPFSKNKNKVCVIISDAFRYEIAAELVSRIEQEDRYTATLEPILAQLPSATKFGMAALLPHKTIEIVTSEDNINVTVETKTINSTENREKILQGKNNNSIAITAVSFKEKSLEEKRILCKNDIIYLYHNKIDATGDKQLTEYATIGAVEDAIIELLELIKQLANANITNILITADHGFIYQADAIDESDFLSDNVDGKEILERTRRYVIGRNLTESKSLRKFKSSELDLLGDVEIQIPNSINRLRLQGSGSSFVHGGASLQEIVVPVVAINKKRQTDIFPVEIDVLSPLERTPITTAQFMVSFYQKEAVTEKMRPRTLRIGLYTKDNELISEVHTIEFDNKSTQAREREYRRSFQLKKSSDKYNGQEVFLKLEGIAPYNNVYKSVTYIIRKSFTTDFDI